MVVSMPKPNPKVLLNAAGNYLKQHPEEVLRAMRGLVSLRFGIPIHALRYLAREFGGGKKAPKDVILDTAPPGLKFQGTINAMGTELRVSVVVTIEELDVKLDQIRVVMRVSELSLKVLDDSETPVAGLIKSGALDLSKPGNLVAFMPKRPAALIDAKDDLITLDLLKIPSIAKNDMVRRTLSVVTPILGVRALQTKNEHLDLHLRASLSGIPEAIAAART